MGFDRWLENADDHYVQLMYENGRQSLNQRCVRVADLEELMDCVNRSWKLDWSDSLREVAGHKAIVCCEDEYSCMSRVSIIELEGEYWLPNDALTNLPARSVTVNVAADELRACVDNSPATPLHDEYDAACAKNGSTAPIEEALIDDTNRGTSKVKFLCEGLNSTTWRPTSCLTDADVSCDGTTDVIESGVKRQRVAPGDDTTDGIELDVNRQHVA